MGIQTFKEDMLAILGRPGTERDTIQAVELLRTCWDGDVSFDFLSGIPGQSENDIIRDFQYALGQSPEHISFYTLTVEDGTRLDREIRKNNIRLLAEDEEYRLWRTGKDILLEMGYGRYEVSNFSLPGKECLHNLKYWHMEPVIGCGPGAVSTIRYGNTVLRIENIRDVEKFLSGDSVFWNSSISLLDVREFLLEYLLMGLRLTEGIKVKCFMENFSRKTYRLVEGIVEKYIERGEMEHDGEFIRCTEAGLDILNRILLEIAIDLDKSVVY
jgi:oxygen-independent coproporphyrinogen-3 oxidase